MSNLMTVPAVASFMRNPTTEFNAKIDAPIEGKAHVDLEQESKATHDQRVENVRQNNW